jgi:hypothetical protein
MSGLKEAVMRNNQEFVRSLRDGMGNLIEADDALNSSSIGVIKAMEEEFGEAWLVRVNPRDGQPVLERAVLAGDCYNCFNFCASFAVPRYDRELEVLLEHRLSKAYEGTRVDAELIDGIYDKATELGGRCLVWS